LALNYITEFNYNSTLPNAQKHNQTLMLQLSLRTLGGSSASTGVTGLGPGSNSVGLPK
jgi:hypothetical protein